MIKREQRNGGLVTDDVLKLLTVVQMTLWPPVVFSQTLNQLVYPLSAYVGTWICHLFGFIVYFRGFIFISHSLIVALIRYVFIVHNGKVMSFGKQNTKNVFWLIALLYPILTIFAYILVYPLDDYHNFDGILSLTKCYGQYVQQFIKSYQVHNLGYDDSHWHKCQLDKVDFSSNPKHSAIALLCIISRTSTFFVASNILESIIYWKIFSYIR